MTKESSNNQGDSRPYNPTDRGSSHGSSGAGRFHPSEPLAAFVLAGKTGSGKSSFIKLLGGRDLEGNPPLVNDGLDSCTKKPTVYVTMFGNRRILLLDTPGFDDGSGLDNLAILNEMSANLYTFLLQKHEIQTQGVIFLHDISERRFAGSQRKTLEILKALCGAEGMENCIIGTTMWSDPGSQKYQDEEVREEAFLRGHWNGILKTTRIPEDDGAVATGIISDLLARPPTLLRIQKEMSIPPHTLENTTVGKVAIPEGRAEADRLKKEYEKEKKKAREDAERREAEYLRQREEQKAQFEEDRARRLEEAKRREEEQQERERELQRLHEKEIREMGERNQKQAEEEANRRREEEKERKDREEREMKAQLEAFTAMQEEFQKKLEESQREFEEKAREAEEDQKEKFRKMNEEFERARSEPKPMPWWRKGLVAIALAGTVVLGAVAMPAAAVAAVVTAAVAAGVAAISGI